MGARLAAWEAGPSRRGYTSRARGRAKGARRRGLATRASQGARPWPRQLCPAGAGLDRPRGRLRGRDRLAGGHSVNARQATGGGHWPSCRAAPMRTLTKQTTCTPCRFGLYSGHAIPARLWATGASPMNATATLRRNRARRHAARNRAAFWREASAWAGVVALGVVALPCAAVLAWLLAAGVNL